MRNFPHGLAGHVVSMTTEGGTNRPNTPWTSVATCECGWQHKLSSDKYKEMDAEIDAHWTRAACVDTQALTKAEADLNDEIRRDIEKEFPRVRLTAVRGPHKESVHEQNHPLDLRGGRRHRPRHN